MLVVIPILCLVSLAGCGSDNERVREIQARRQARLQTEAKQDHLGDVFALLDKFVSLNAAKAQQQVTYHLNEWRKSRSDSEQAIPAADLLSTVDQLLDETQIATRVNATQFADSDVLHLRDCYLFNRLNRWINTSLRDDILLDDWLTEQEKILGEDAGDQLRTAARLFDWTIRNIAFEPLQGEQPAGVNVPEFSSGMIFQGPGYRQDHYQALMRGSGDAYQRAGVFMQLCTQAGIDSAFLATQSTDTGDITPWCVGVFVGEEVYLFEPGLGIHIPGPSQTGIATLSDARTDAAVVRRLGVPGFFDYPLTKADVQQTIALLDFVPEACSSRMRVLEGGLTGDRRMNVYTDVDALAKKLDEYSGVAGVRLWEVPLLSEIYFAEIEKVVERDPRLLFWYRSRWAFLDSGVGLASDLASGRWDHLVGLFADSDDESVIGARTKYLRQRSPEYEIADLDIDVELQKAYGIRRELGMSAEQYQFQISQLQNLMRNGKRTATYWLGLLQFDDGELETARNWLGVRVLDEKQVFERWKSSARYNLARTLELLGQTDEAIELYKTDGDRQEHGNRVRARLVAKLKLRDEQGKED